MSRGDLVTVILWIVCGVALTLFAVVAAFLVFVFWQLRQVERAGLAKVPEGQVIVRAIEAYRHSTGHLPESLAKLVPDYVKGDVHDWGYERWTPENLKGEGEEKGGGKEIFFLTCYVPGCGVGYDSERGWTLTVRDSATKELGFNPILSE